MNDYPLPHAVLVWLANLPLADRTRETMIAERNWDRICRHIKGAKQ